MTDKIQIEWHRITGEFAWFSEIGRYRLYYGLTDSLLLPRCWSWSIRVKDDVMAPSEVGTADTEDEAKSAVEKRLTDMLACGNGGVMTLEEKRALLTPDWTLGIYRPTPENMPESLLWGGSQYWTLSEHQMRDRYYIRPTRLTVTEYKCTLYDTEDEALDAWIKEEHGRNDLP